MRGAAASLSSSSWGEHDGQLKVEEEEGGGGGGGGGLFSMVQWRRCIRRQQWKNRLVVHTVLIQLCNGMCTERPLEDGLEEEEEECVSEENELLAKDEFSAEENFTAEFEAENMSCEDMEYFCNKGEEDGNRDAGESEMDTQGEKARRTAAGPDEWDGPRELDAFLKDGERRIHSRQQLPVGTTWGPFEGKIEMSTDSTALAALSEFCAWLELIAAHSSAY
ncbi:hypothetical protein F2P81_001523 [Scophthalmus maximus]|uniref:Zinc finger protein ZFPM1/2 PR domain-containing protein n=1 Tax=Scophthalmus maximus TaxID=52904 RepID=A0A6A4TP28_SCOMX|nr:hypothetical protein F2P81_001523 [Scophthalmus maximus]